MRRFMVVMFLAAAPVVAQEEDPKASEGWVQLPSEGEADASAFAVVRNPGMYDLYLVSAASEIASKLELRDGMDGKAKELTVPAYGTLEMKPDGPHVAIEDLKRPLEEGETIRLTLTTDSSFKIHVDAVVRKP